MAAWYACVAASYTFDRWQHGMPASRSNCHRRGTAYRFAAGYLSCVYSNRRLIDLSIATNRRKYFRRASIPGVGYTLQACSPSCLPRVHRSSISVIALESTRQRRQKRTDLRDLNFWSDHSAPFVPSTVSTTLRESSIDSNARARAAQ